MFKSNYFLSFILICLISSGCNLTKHVPEGDSLYMGERIKIEANGPIPNKNRLMDELEDVTGPETNFTFLGMRPKLGLYNLFGGPDARGIWRWLRDRIGEPPILLSVVKPDRVQDLMINRLFNNGHYNPEVEYNIITENKKSEVEYIAHINPPFTINEIYFPDGDSEIEERIRETKENTLLRIGDPYNLNTLTEERVRIDLELENQGYYYFSDDALIFRVDSTIGNRSLNIYLAIKPQIPEQITRKFRINDIYVNTNHIQGVTPENNDTILYNQNYYISSFRQYRPAPIFRSIFLEKDSLYSRQNHIFSLSRLMGLGVFSFANIRYEEQPSEGDGLLNAYINLTPLRRKSLRAEVQGVSKSNNFIGPSIIARFINRNAFRGAELLQLNLTAGYETQIISRRRMEEMQGRQRFASYELGAEIHLQIPRFIAPFRFQTSSRFVPKTNFRLGIQHLNRTQFFTMNSFNTSAGYTWRETTVADHVLNVININYLQLSNRTAEFEQILEDRTFLRRSFQQQFILGSNYTYTFNTQLREEDPASRNRRRKRHDFFFRGNVDVSGNLMHAIQSLINEDDPTEDEPYTLFGAPYSQYSRLETDFRYYYKPTERQTFATRLLMGAGFPYGNSTILPYVKQFFMGGPNSIRAFRARQVGPGGFVPEEGGFLFFDQVGDLMFETNFEYRFPLVSVVNGAVFLDAGNIWLLRELDRPEGIFEFNNFFHSLAVGTGFGVRVDVSFFVLRFDLGIPLRIPHREEWVIDEFKWRNAILNIAVGYPF
jgi:outer membrane protein assembly factor BamA